MPRAASRCAADLPERPAACHAGCRQPCHVFFADDAATPAAFFFLFTPPRIFAILSISMLCLPFIYAFAYSRDFQRFPSSPRFHFLSLIQLIFQVFIAASSTDYAFKRSMFASA